MSEIEVVAHPSGDGWRCEVEVIDPESSTRHVVTVDRATLERLAPGSNDPVALVRASFGFLLERESKGSILAVFELPVIGHYFPTYERDIRLRLG